MDRLVKSAVDKAQSQGKDILAGTIQKIYLDNMKDSRVADILEANLSQVATDGQIVEFRHSIKNTKYIYSKKGDSLLSIQPLERPGKNKKDEELKDPEPQTNPHPL